MTTPQNMLFWKYPYMRFTYTFYVHINNWLHYYSQRLWFMHGFCSFCRKSTSLFYVIFIIAQIVVDIHILFDLLCEKMHIIKKMFPHKTLTCGTPESWAQGKLASQTPGSYVTCGSFYLFIFSVLSSRKTLIYKSQCNYICVVYKVHRFLKWKSRTLCIILVLFCVWLLTSEKKILPIKSL